MNKNAALLNMKSILSNNSSFIYALNPSKRVFWRVSFLLTFLLIATSSQAIMLNEYEGECQKISEFYQPESGENMDKLAIVIAAPDYKYRYTKFDDTRYGTDDVEVFQHFKKSGVPTLIIGDYYQPLNYEIIEYAIKEVDLSLPKKIIIVIEGHGGIDEEKDYIIRLNRAFHVVKTKELFRLFALIFEDRPIDVLLMSCFGGGAVKDVDELPKGSSLLVLTQADKAVHVDESRLIFMKHCRRQSSNGIEDYSVPLVENYAEYPERFSLQHFLLKYLFTLEETNNMPTLVFADGKKEFDYKEFERYLGGRLDDEQRNVILSKLESYCISKRSSGGKKIFDNFGCFGTPIPYSNECQSNILKALSKIEKANSIDDLKSLESISEKYFSFPKLQTDFSLCFNVKSSDTNKSFIPDHVIAGINSLCDLNVSRKKPLFGIALAALYMMEKSDRIYFASPIIY